MSWTSDNLEPVAPGRCRHGNVYASCPGYHKPLPDFGQQVSTRSAPPPHIGECPFCGQAVGDLPGHIVIAHPSAEMAASDPEPLARDTLEADPGTGAWLGLVLLVLAFVVGVAFGWLVGGVR